LGALRTSTTRSRAATSPSSIARLRAAIERRGFRRVDGHFAHALHAPTGGSSVSGASATNRASRRSRCGPTTASSSGTSWNRRGRSRLLEAALDPVLGKSVVYYFELEGDREQPVVGESLAEWGLEPAVDYIERVQRSDGLILWYPDGPADPWDHVESAMGLSVGGRHEAARRAYRWVADAQHDDGALWATYGEPDDDGDDGSHAGDEPRKETHRSAYVAVGAWHHYLCTEDREFLEDLWPTVRDAVEFACDQQAPTGEVYWTVGADGGSTRTRCSPAAPRSARSLACGAAVADELGHEERRDRWLEARTHLGEAIRSRPDRFDRTWESKSRYAMDWFYPVLCGVMTGDSARDRLEDGMDRFLEAGWAVGASPTNRVTVAESCVNSWSRWPRSGGRERRAREILEWLFPVDRRRGDLLTGYQFEDEEFWPGERPTWTCGGGGAGRGRDFGALAGRRPLHRSATE